MPKYHVEVQEVRTLVYEIEADSIQAAKDRFFFDHEAEPISDTTTPIDVSDILEVEEAK